jgi:hypothetical protein
LIVEDFLYDALCDNGASSNTEGIKKQRGNIACPGLTQFDDIDGGSEGTVDVKEKSYRFLVGHRENQTREE